MRVRLYRNLSIKDHKAWSLVKSGKVVDVVDGVILVECKFIVSEATRQRIIHVRKKKTPCCYVEGEVAAKYALNSLPKTMTAAKLLPGSNVTTEIVFDPWTMPFFMRADCKQFVHEADVVVAAPTGVFAELPACDRRARRLQGLHGLHDNRPISSFSIDDWNG